MNILDSAQKKGFFNALKNNVHPKHWDLWFGTLDISSVDDSEKIVKFVVGNLFIKEWLKNEYGLKIGQVVKRFFGDDFAYVIDFYTLGEENTSESSDSEKNEPLIKKKPLALSKLNPQYTFDKFVSGAGNDFAFNSAIEVSKNPGIYNPLFIFGGVGLGKTHLLQAVGHYVMDNSPHKKVLYVTSETFMNELYYSIKTNTVEKFREKYRDKADVLLIDDIQFLIGKTGAQNELFHTFNQLYDEGKQIVFCSDRNPEDLGTFHERLISRFQMGLLVEVSSPDVSTREKIIRKFAETESLELSEEVISFLAVSVASNIRKIYGYLIKLILANKFQGKGLDVKTVKSLLGEICPGINESKVINLSPENKIFNAAKTVFGFEKEDLKSSSRKKEISEARMISMYVASKYMKEQTVSISEWFKKTHSSVNYSVNKIKKQHSEENSRINGYVDAMLEILSDDIRYIKA